LKFCDNDKKKERETIDAIVKKGNLREKILECRVKNYKNYEVSAKYANHENVKNNYTKKEKRTTRQLNKKKRIEQKRLIDNRKKEIRYLKRWIIIK
jgi:hypothetical protein